DGRDAELARAAGDPDRDLAPVGDEQTLRQHDGSATISPRPFRVDPGKSSYGRKDARPTVASLVCRAGFAGRGTPLAPTTDAPPPRPTPTQDEVLGRLYRI